MSNLEKAVQKLNRELDKHFAKHGTKTTDGECVALVKLTAKPLVKLTAKLTESWSDETPGAGE